MAQIILFPRGTNSAAGQAAPPFRLPVAFGFMPKLSKVVRDQIQLEKLEKKLIILSSKIEVLTSARSEAEEQINRLKLVIDSPK